MEGGREYYVETKCPELKHCGVYINLVEVSEFLSLNFPHLKNNM